MLNKVSILLSAWTAGLIHVVISFPYALLIIGSRLVGFPDNLEEAAMDLGASYWGALLRVTLPIAAPALVAAFLLCFTISFDEYSIASFLVGTQPTLPVYMYSHTLPHSFAPGRRPGSNLDDGFDDSGALG